MLDVSGQKHPEKQSFDEFIRDLSEKTEITQPYSENYGLIESIEQYLTILEEAHQTLSHLSERKSLSSSGMEWFLDNYYMLLEASELVLDDLPKTYFHKLPGLAAEDGHPRIYVIAQKILAHFELDLVQTSLNQTLKAYQQRLHLQMSELWALPLMLRLVLIEAIAGSMPALVEQNPKMAPSAKVDLPTLELDEIIARAIRTLILLERIDWKKLFESHSQVEKILRKDPAGVYSQMDFETRDLYRNKIEGLADHSAASEIDIAQSGISLAKANASGLPKGRHVGYYLVGDGEDTLRGEIRYQDTFKDRWQRFFFDHAAIFYVGAILIFTLIITLGLTLVSGRFTSKLWQQFLIGLLCLIPASSMVVNLINSILTTSLPPRILPKMDFRERIPREFRTMVAIPAMLTEPAEIDFLIRQLELHYLANKDPNIGFVLLSDFNDAPERIMPEDAALLERAISGIQNLNRRYQADQGLQPFFLFHRQRQWNPQEDAWMGWERKRGKLTDFNRYLLEGFTDSWDQIVGDIGYLEQVRFIITADSDTILPHDSAALLIATLAHPLNQAEFADNSTTVTSGYTILQPRTEVKPTSVNQSPFTRIFAGDLGLDLYTRAVSDVYQDLFGEGIFVGKGIYDVAAFMRSLKDKVPQNALLSHDLFEGIQGRAALVTDVVFFEDYPPDYNSQVIRQHRWVRGDWQLLPWVFARVPMGDGEFQKNPFSLIDLWKVVDNLRRSLLSPTTLLAIIAGWLMFPQGAWIWTLLILLVSAFTLVKSIVTSFSARFLKSASLNVWTTIKTVLNRWLLWVAFLPYEALSMVDAIAATLVRLLISHQRLLQWQTSAHTVRIFGQQRKITATWSRMLNAPIASLVIGVLVYFVNPPAFWTSVPLLVIWAFSPQIAYWISLKQTSNTPDLSQAELQQLRRIARRTWLYFERFIGPEDHWLPPDHFQEDPKGLVAHRTSPTNIGLLMMATASAYDLGYIGIPDFVYRMTYTFETLDGMEKYRGHLLNWYDTQTLETLSPRYVSTVDSGNYAVSLVGLRQTLLDLKYHPIVSDSLFNGAFDTLDVFCSILRGVKEKPFRETAETLQRHCRQIQQELRKEPLSDSRVTTLLEMVIEQLTKPMQSLTASLLQDEKPISPTLLQDLRFWSDAVFQHFTNIQRQITLFAPWLQIWQTRPSFILEMDPPLIQGSFQILEDEHALTIPLVDLPQISYQILTQIESLSANQLAISLLSSAEQASLLTWLDAMATSLQSSKAQALSLIEQIDFLTETIQFHLERMEFSFLYDPQREVFFLGYQVGSGRLDQNHYDLLASEARTASLYAIATNDVPRDHWLHLNRPFTRIKGNPTLISWNGSMFEYLMPNLFTHTYPGTLLEQTGIGVVKAQIDYAKKKGVPWGISESSYYHFDSADNYQYQGFGVPGLGRKRGLADNLVIAPYASLMAVAVDPKAVLANIHALKKEGALGQFGFFEALDYTPARMPIGHDKAIVKTYMAHHQGMILVALGNYLSPISLVDRIHSDPQIESTELLLQEQIPQVAPAQVTQQTEVIMQGKMMTSIHAVPWRVIPNVSGPSAQTLSNGHLRLFTTTSGSGYLAWNNITLTRWQPDAALDPWGIWFYLQDLESKTTWSIGQKPVNSSPNEYHVFFAPHMTEIRRFEQGLRTNLQTTIAPQEDVCIQKVTLTNQTNQTRKVRLVSYGEVALAPQATDQRHPAFNKLFIQSDFDESLRMLHFQRRKRSSEEADLGMAHLVFDPLPGEVEYESDRKKFLGRGHNNSHPAALTTTQPLSGTVGTTLDPIFSIGRRVTLKPHETVEIVFLTLAAKDHSAAAALASQYQDPTRIENTFIAAEAHSEKLMRVLNLTSPQMARFAQLLTHVLYPVPALRPAASILARNTLGQSGLWPFGISGDYPLLLVTIDQKESIETLQETLLAHSYWRKMGLTIDLVILNTWDSGYAHELNERIHHAINALDSSSWVNRRGGIFVLTAGQMEASAVTLLKTAASVVLDTKTGKLADHLRLDRFGDPLLPALIPTGHARQFSTDGQVKRPEGLLFDNGMGGFTPDGKEYQIYLHNYPKSTQEVGQISPAPWINVIANEDFGFIVSESGGGYSWAVNSSENRLTPWTNDPVSDPSGEAIYLRDEITGAVWSPTPYPAGDGANYLVRHGQGYTIFESVNSGIKQELRLFTAPDAPVKVAELTLTNLTEDHRRLTATYFAEWVLGVDRGSTKAFIIPEFDNATGSLLARNTYSAEFSERVAFLTSDYPVHGLTTDRHEFLGVNSDRKLPQALQLIGLSGKVQAGVDPCAALQTHLNFSPGAGQTVRFVIGQGANRAESLLLAERFSQPGAARESFEEAIQNWEKVLTTLQVKTPLKDVNLILNRWLQYQALSCRIWGRSGFYQSSGAYGFRDQLQDVMAVLATRPDIARAQILRAAHHQFDAGDVLHWWHPPSGRGVRTRITDDLLWLVYVTWEYVQKTGDASVLDETIPFLLGEPLKAEEDERYGHYPLSETRHTLFEHCRRALDHGDTSGPHGLPLIGGGDWNDGMNRVGIEGHGESVWLGWFLVENHRRFADLCRLIGESELAEAHIARADALAAQVNQVAWDGEWYLRAYYDDGTPLGSHRNEECQIDSLPQSWAVLSDAAPADRQKQAMESALKYLMQEDGRLIRLFTPPFNETEKDPGYIKGYPPGIRENGGQYTHAAVWSVWAITKLGEGNRALALFQYLNPITHSTDLESANRYGVEPYVVAADVYSMPPYVGQGGWTWYTGASGWLYRLGMEAILGFRLQGDHFMIDPCIPAGWDGFEMTYTHNGSIYRVQVQNPEHVQKGVRRVSLDGNTVSDGRIPIEEDSGGHTVTVILGATDNRDG